MRPKVTSARVPILLPGLRSPRQPPDGAGEKPSEPSPGRQLDAVARPGASDELMTTGLCFPLLRNAWARPGWGCGCSPSGSRCEDQQAAACSVPCHSLSVVKGGGAAKGIFRERVALPRTPKQSRGTPTVLPCSLSPGGPPAHQEEMLTPLQPESGVRAQITLVQHRPWPRARAPALPTRREVGTRTRPASRRGHRGPARCDEAAKAVRVEPELEARRRWAWLRLPPRAPGCTCRRFLGPPATPEHHGSRKSPHPGHPHAPPHCPLHIGDLDRGRAPGDPSHPSVMASLTQGESAGMFGRPCGRAGGRGTRSCQEAGMRGTPLPALLPAPPPRTPGRTHREAGKVTDAASVKGVGGQVHPEPRTKADSVPRSAAQFPVPPTLVALGPRRKQRTTDWGARRRKGPGLFEDPVGRLWPGPAAPTSRNTALTGSRACLIRFTGASGAFPAPSPRRALPGHWSVDL